MFNPKFRFTHDEIRIIVLALVELKNQLLAEGRYSTDLQSPESAEHLCAKTKQYADNWTPVAEKLWEERQKES